MSQQSAEEARRSHSILSAVREAVLVWYALLGGIGAWAVHLVFFAAYVRFTCTQPGSLWAMHLVTAVTLAMTTAAIGLSLRMLSRARGDQADDDEGGRAQFVARLGVMVGAVNFALIALEEIYLVALLSRRCG